MPEEKWDEKTILWKGLYYAYTQGDEAMGNMWLKKIFKMEGIKHADRASIRGNGGVVGTCKS